MRSWIMIGLGMGMVYISAPNSLDATSSLFVVVVFVLGCF